MPHRLILSPAVSLSTRASVVGGPDLFAASKVSFTATFHAVSSRSVGGARRLEGNPRPPRPAIPRMIATLAPAAGPARTVVPGPVRHQGFTLEVRASRRDDGGWGYAVLHEGHLLHAEGGGYRSPRAAERAARALVDDALMSFDHAIAEARV